jgi:hypothetical protein
MLPRLMPPPRFERSLHAVRRIAAALPILFVVIALYSVWHYGGRTEQTRSFGDDHEYLTMTMSLVLHDSPDYRSGDGFRLLPGLPFRWRNALLHRVFSDKPPLGYYAGRDGRYYSYHFMTYSALVAPLRAWFASRPDASRAHQLANMLVFSAALLSLLLLRRKPRVFWVIAPLLFVSPVLWFLPYAHPEAFVYSCGIAALCCYLRGYVLPALALTALAATQYQPLALLALCLGAQLIWNELRGRPVFPCASSAPGQDAEPNVPVSTALLGERSRGSIGRRRVRPTLLITGVFASSVAFLPDAFYFWRFGSPNLIAREGFARTSFLSASKFGSLFFDLDTGMLCYAPGLLLWLLVAAGLCLRRSLSERAGWGLALLGCALVGMFASTSARNWNHPTFGLSRYALDALPTLALFIGNELARTRLRARWLVAVALLAGALQLLVYAQFGLFEYRGPDSSHHSPLARYVLAHWPALYSPPAEIFCERTLPHCPQDPDTSLPFANNYPVIYLDERGIARKVLTGNCDASVVLGAWPWNPEQRARLAARLKKCHATGPVYLEP